MKKRLKEIADIRVGYQFREKATSDENANVTVIQIKDIDENRRIQVNDLLPVKIDRPEPYLVSKGDVLFLSRGHRQYAALVADPIRSTIATSYFAILRPNVTKLLSEYLMWSINGPDFQEQLRPFVQGTHMPFVSMSDFRDLTIDLPPLAIQQQILDLQHLLERERKLTAALVFKRETLVREVAKKLMTGELNAKDN